MRDYENSRSSQGLVAVYSPDTSLDGGPCAPSSSTPTPQAFLSNVKMTDFSRLSRFGMTFAPLTDAHGEAALTSFLAAFPAKPIPRRLRAEMLRTISGRKCDGSWQMQLPGTYLQRTLHGRSSKQPAMTSKRWVTKPSQLPLERQTWAAITFGPGLGYLHTPTTKANYCAASMQKWPCARAFVTVFGQPTPENHEWLMGWPHGWTDLQPLEMDKFLLWRSQQPSFSPLAEAPP